jgi:2-haloacid dehalogenase
MAEIKDIIFDLGGVLIDWQPDRMYAKIILDENKRNWFLHNICTLAWNEEQDGGRTIAEATELLISQYPEYQEWIEAYYLRWEEMLSGPIQETVDVFRKLRQNPSYKIYALTNWSAETFPRALQLFDFLHWFDGRVVSGEEKTRKPFRDIYEIILNRFGLVPEKTLFIDDNLRNIKAAEEMGIVCHHFTSAAALENYLINEKLLTE